MDATDLVVTSVAATTQFNFDLGVSDLSGSEFMSAVASNFDEVFPVHGRTSQLTGNGQRMNLSWGPSRPS